MGHSVQFNTQGYYSHEAKSAEFLVYETTGETDCTDLQETANPVFMPGKIVVNAPAHPPLNLPDQIELNEGDTHNTTGLPALAPDFDNRTKVTVRRSSGDEDVVVTPAEFWIERGNYDFGRWPNLQITAATDVDMVDDEAWFMFRLSDRGRYLTNDRFKVVVRDTATPGIEVQADGLESYVRPSANLKDADRQLEITDGESVDLRIRLTQAPDADLTLSASLDQLHSSETLLEGVTVAPGQLTFTSSNWNTWQTMSISAVAGAGERGILYLDARVPSGDPYYAPGQDVSFDIALFRMAAVDPAPPPGGTGTACDSETTVSTELACLNNLAQAVQDRINLLSQ